MILLKRYLWFFNVLILGISAVASVLIGECLVRIFMPHADIAEWYQPHQKYHHVLKTNFYQKFRYQQHDAIMTVQTNVAGFRDEEHGCNTKNGMKIVFLGDSFVFGYGLEIQDRLDTQLKKLAEKAGMNLETVNWGVPGWGTSHQSLFAADHLSEEKPDVLVLLFCNNDPENDRGFGLPALPDKESVLYPLKTFLRQYSHVYRWLLEIRARKIQGFPLYSEQAEGDITPEDWSRTSEYISQIHKSLVNANPEGKMLVLAAAPEDMDTIGHLQQIADSEAGIFYIDLLPFFSDIEPAERIMPWDGHWSARVHAAAAQAIFTWIRETRQE